MAKITNFRFDDNDRAILDALVSDWKMSARAVVSELLRRADPRGGVHVEPDPGVGGKFSERVLEPDVQRAVYGEKGPPRADEAAPIITAAQLGVPSEPPTAVQKMQVAVGGMKRVTEIPTPNWKKDAPVARGETRTLTGRAHGSVPKGGKK